MSADYKAEGRVAVGLSYPVVATYNPPGGRNSYKDGRIFARLDSYDVNITTAGDENVLHLNNAVAENAGTVFSSGTLTLVTDHPLPDVEDFVYGNPEPETIEIGGEQIPYSGMSTENVSPNLGLGMIVKFISGGEYSFAPIIFPKVAFRQGGDKGKTQGKNIEFQLRTFTVDLARDDAPKPMWKYNIRKYFSSEADARALLNKIMGVAEAANG